MGQHDYVVDNAPGSAVRTDINNFLTAIVTNNSGATAPATTYAHQWWADTANNIIKQRNAANNAWIERFAIDSNKSPGNFEVEGRLTLTGGAAVSTIDRDVDSERISIVGATVEANGAYIRLYGSAHGSVPNEINHFGNKHVFDTQSGTFLGQILSTGLEIESDITLTGTGMEQIKRDITTQSLQIRGGTAADGAAITLNGGSEASNPDDAFHFADTHNFLNQAGGSTHHIEFKLGGAGTMANFETSNAEVANFNRKTSDGTIIGFSQDGTQEGTITISGTATSYNSFCGSHYTQLKDGQKELPVGAVVVSAGEIIPCGVEKEIEVDIAFNDAIETIQKEAATETKEIEVDNKYEHIYRQDAFETFKNGNKREKRLKPDVFIKGNKYYMRKKPVKVSVGHRYDIESGEEIEVFEDQYEKKTIKIKPLKNNVFYNEKTRTFYKAKDGYRIDPKNEKVYETKRVDVPDKEYFPYVDTTTKAGDKAVYGTWFGRFNSTAEKTSFGIDDKEIYLIAQVGLFKARVTDTNGNIKNGDFLETSTRPMEAQRQSAKTKSNSTLAKSMVDVDWSEIEVDPELGYKWKLIPITF